MIFKNTANFHKKCHENENNFQNGRNFHKTVAKKCGYNRTVRTLTENANGATALAVLNPDGATAPDGR